MKRISLLLAALTLSLSIVGCGEKTSVKTEKKVTGPGGSTTTTTTTETKKTGENPPPP